MLPDDPTLDFPRGRFAERIWRPMIVGPALMSQEESDLLLESIFRARKKRTMDVRGAFAIWTSRNRKSD